MSRIGYLPIEIPEGVTLTVDDNNLVVAKGPKGELSQQVEKVYKVSIQDNKLSLSRPSEDKEHKSKHGMYRSLISNMVTGVSTGYDSPRLIIVETVSLFFQVSGSKPPTMVISISRVKGSVKRYSPVLRKIVFRPVVSDWYKALSIELNGFSREPLYKSFPVLET